MARHAHHAQTVIAQTTVGHVQRPAVHKITDRLSVVDGLYRQQTERWVWWSADGNDWHGTAAAAARAASAQRWQRTLQLARVAS